MSHTPRLGVYIDSRTVLTGAEDVQSATSSALGDAGADAQLCQSVREHLKGDVCHAYTATGTLGDGQRRIAGVPSLHHIGAGDDALRQDLAIGAPWRPTLLKAGCRGRGLRVYGLFVALRP